MEIVSSVADQCVSLLANNYPDAITHPDLWTGWEDILGEPVNLGSEQYTELAQEWGHPTNCCVSNKLNELLMAALQQYSHCSSTRPIALKKALFLEASQLLDIEQLDIIG